MRKWAVLWTILLLGMFGVIGFRAPDVVTENAEEETCTVVATSFYQYDFARQILGDESQVTLLIPPGKSEGRYELSQKDLDAILQADVFVCRGSEIWLDRVQEARLASAVPVPELVCMNEVVPETAHSGCERQCILLSPANAKKLLEAIADAVKEADPKNRMFYEQNKQNYKAQIEALNPEGRMYSCREVTEEEFLNGATYVSLMQEESR